MSGFVFLISDFQVARLKIFHVLYMVLNFFINVFAMVASLLPATLSYFCGLARLLPLVSKQVLSLILAFIYLFRAFFLRHGFYVWPGCPGTSLKTSLASNSEMHLPLPPKCWARIKGVGHHQHLALVYFWSKSYLGVFF